jgi:hypothetical protein
VTRTSLIVALALVTASSASFAKGGSHSGAAAPGTGSKSSFTHVHGYVRKDGTYVAPHNRSTPDKKFENNWTTKGNNNPTTGASGTRVTKPKK